LGYIISTNPDGVQTSNFNWEMCGAELFIDFGDDDYFGSYFNPTLTYNIDGTFTGYWYPFDGPGSCFTLFPTIGCTDSSAYNYDPLSISDDSSCQYCTIDVTVISIDPSSVYNCDGSAFAIVNGNIGDINYNWSAGNDNYFLTGICAGTYTIQVTDSVGCTALDTFTIVQNGLVFGCTDLLAENYDTNATIDNGSCLYCDLNTSITAIQNSSVNSCDGTAVVYATTNANPLTYIWNNESTTPYIQHLCSGYYTVVVTDAVQVTILSNTSLMSSIVTELKLVGTTTTGVILSTDLNFCMNSIISSGFLCRE
jgi:hypothetical protein